MENLPIIVVHTGNPYYLEPILKQTRMFNPDNRICLVSDPSTRNIPCVEHFLIKEYAAEASEFANVYQHLSINSYSFELFCFQRWFYVKEFAKSQGFERFVCLDSDFLLFEQVDKFYAPYLSYDFTTCSDNGPICILFHKESIERFCTFCTELYTRPEYFTVLKDLYQSMLDKHQIGGICDMTAFRLYPQYVSRNVVDIAIPRQSVCMDLRIRSSYGFEMDSEHPDIMGNISKKIYWIDNRPYGKYLETGELVRFAGIHLQGGAKRMLPYFLLDSKGRHREGFLPVLKWNLKPKVINHTVIKALRWKLNPQVIKRKCMSAFKNKNTPKKQN